MKRQMKSGDSVWFCFWITNKSEFHVYWEACITSCHIFTKPAFKYKYISKYITEETICQVFYNHIQNKNALFSTFP